MVSPIEANCADLFKYTGYGEIKATDEPDKQAAAKETIEGLGLNINKRQKMRSKAIDKILRDIEDCTNEEIKQLAVGYDRPDAAGQYTRCAVLWDNSIHTQALLCSRGPPQFSEAINLIGKLDRRIEYNSGVTSW